MRLQIHPEGPEFSTLAAGFWRMNEWGMTLSQKTAFVEKCLEYGITTFDHADIYGTYGNESLFGEILKNKPSLREKMELVSKCGICLAGAARPGHAIQHYNTTSGHIRRSVENSLKNLNTDYLDLVLIHRPDPLMDASETADSFMALKEEGKIKHAGVSNFTPSQFELLQNKLAVPLVTNQVECSLLRTKPIYDGTFDQAQRMSSSPMLWSPFGGGDLFRGETEQSQRVLAACKELSPKYGGASVAQLALAWLIRLPCRPLPVLGTGKTERIAEAAEAVSIKLERQDWFILLEASRGHGVA